MIHIRDSSHSRARLLRVKPPSTLTLTVKAGLAFGVAAGGIALALPPAQAGTCSSQTGGSNNQLIWTGNASKPYACGYTASTGNKSISAWATQSWTSSTAKGYSKNYNCQSQSGGVTVTYIYSDSAGTGLGSSITYTAFNGSTGGRHWTGAVLWTTSGANGNQYNHSCSGYQIYANLMYIATASMTGPSSITPGSQATFSVTVKNPDGGPAPTGTVALFKQVGSSPSPAGKNCDGSATSGVDPAIGQGTLSNGVATIKTPTTLPAGSYTLYAAYTGTPVTSSGLPSYCLTPPQAGLTGAQTASVPLTVGSTTASLSSAPATQTANVTVNATRGALAASKAKNPRLTVRNSSTTAPKDITARCKAAQVPVQFSVGSEKQITDRAVTLVDRGISVETAALPDGTVVDVQLVCRPKSAKMMKIGRMAYGSATSDIITTAKRNATVLAGLGDDVVTLNKRGSAFGGPGADMMAVNAPGSASGGPGADTLVSDVKKGLVLLNGGPGRDQFVGSDWGTTLINAKDGRGGDLVVCTSQQTYVMSDTGDTLRGSCQKPSARK